MTIKNIPTWYYQQFDADYSLDIPAEGYGGWKKKSLPINPEKTAIVIMHAWDCGTYEQYPGWHRAVEYIPRAQQIAAEVFSVLLPEARDNGIKIFHLTNGFEYGHKYPGYKIAQEICKKHSADIHYPKLSPPVIDDTSKLLKTFKRENSFVGLHNEKDIEIGKGNMSFPVEAIPFGNEPVVENSEQLHAVCLENNINHLIYIGFAINWCLQHADGNMNDMHSRGFLCSTIRQAVTAVENKKSARTEANKEHGLWVTAVQNGFVYDLDDFLGMLTIG
ncbi:MAG: hypothetical protein J7L77_04685 [Clostridiales bacterium]|nr:hypothetical protein [Clostridiales bacterium]